jgi:hypothetical protein
MRLAQQAQLLQLVSCRLLSENCQFRLESALDTKHCHMFGAAAAGWWSGRPEL